jgi:hypothetical protein
MWAFDLAVDRLVQEKRVFLLGSLLTVFQPESKKSLLRSTPVEYRLPHPSDPHRYAIYGFDPQRRGYWAEVRQDGYLRNSYAPVIHDDVQIAIRGGVLDRYHALSPLYLDCDPVRGLLVFLGEAGFFPGSDAEDALLLVQARGLNGLPERLWVVGEVIRNLDLDGG